jgi:NAD+ synthase
LEWAMLECEKENPTLNYSERETEVLKIYHKLNSSNKHKMLPIPICIIPKELQ